MQINTATITIAIATTAGNLLTDGLGIMAYAEVSERAYYFQFNVLVDGTKDAAATLTTVITTEYAEELTMKTKGEGCNAKDIITILLFEYLAEPTGLTR